MTSALDGITVLDLTRVPPGRWPPCFSVTTAPGSSGSSMWMTRRHGVAAIWCGIAARRACGWTSRITPPRAWYNKRYGEPTASYMRLLRSADVLVEDFSPSSSHQAIVSLTGCRRSTRVWCTAPSPPTASTATSRRSRPSTTWCWPVWASWRPNRDFVRRRCMWCIPCRVPERHSLQPRASLPRCWPEKRPVWDAMSKPP